jgi:hypothetical protein
MTITQQVRFVCEDKEEFERLKAKATKLRIILLERKEKQMFCRLSTFSKRDKDKFIAEVNKMWSEMTDEEIDEEFNAICCDKLFEGGVDVSNLPVKEMTYPDHSVLYEPVQKDQEIETKLAHIENLSFEEVKCST